MTYREKLKSARFWKAFILLWMGYAIVYIGLESISRSFHFSGVIQKALITGAIFSFLFNLVVSSKPKV